MSLRLRQEVQEVPRGDGGLMDPQLLTDLEKIEDRLKTLQVRL